VALAAGLGAWQVGLAGIVAAMAVEPMRWFWTLPLPLFALGLVVWLELLRRISAERALEGEASIEVAAPIEVEIDLSDFGVPEVDLEEELVRRAELDDTLQHLAQLESSMTALVARVPVGIVTSDGRGSILSLNPAAEQLFGHAAVDLTGLSMRVLLPGVFGTDNQQALSRDVDPLADAPDREPLRTYALRGDYNTIPVLCSCIRVRGDAVETLTWVIHPLDATAALPNVVKPTGAALDSTARYSEDFQPFETTPPVRAPRNLDETVRPPAESVPPGGYVPEPTGPFVRQDDLEHRLLPDPAGRWKRRP